MALYHTHRPQTFADIVDQEHIVKTLENQIKADNVAHAYLFNGPRGVGKTTTARILAKALNCEKRKEGTSEPCNTCTSCAEISSSHSIDVIEIDAASHTGVDNVRQNIIENAQFQPTKSSYKVFIIDEVHMLSTAAFNALLKTLEEPPSYIVFILATTDPQKLPATIISRCQRFTFGKVATEDMKKHVKSIAKKEGVKIDDDVLMRIVMKSEGCARDAISLLDQLMATDDKHITAESAGMVLPTTDIEHHVRFVQSLLDKNQSDALCIIDELRNAGTSMPHFMTDFILFLRTLLLASVDEARAMKEVNIAKDYAKDIHKILEKTSQQKIIALIDLSMKRAGEIKTAPLPDLPVEMLVIEWTVDTRPDTQSTRQNDSSPAVVASQVTDHKESNSDQATIQTNVEETLKKPVEAVESKTETTPPNNKTIKQSQQSDAKQETEENKIDEPQANSQILTQADVETKWTECIAAIEREMMSLSFVFKMGEIKKVENNIITMAVGFNFHQEKLTDIMTKPKIEAILSDVLGTKVNIDVTVDEAKADDNKPKPSTELNDLAAAFGGEVL